MSYFGGSGRMAGDPGFFGSLFRGVKGAVGGFIKGGPIGAVTGGVGAAFRPPTGRAVPRAIQQVIPTPGMLGQMQRFVPGGATGLQVMPDGTVRKKRRRMNAGNPKALRRAIRRQNAFVNLAKGALKNTGFKVVSTSAGKMTAEAWQKKRHHSR